MSDYITIPLSKRGKHAGEYEALVDAVDSDLAQFNWSVEIAPYTQYANYRNKNLKMHRIILARKLERQSLLPTEYVDHIDGNGLNNRRENLRLASCSQNNRNTRKRSNNTSGYKGVSKVKNREKWIAQIFIDGTNKYLGRFDTPELAYQAYCEKAKELYGEFANYGD